MNLYDIETPDNFNLFLFGDDHEGSKLRHDDGWGQLVDAMHSSYADLPASLNFGVDHGDIVEAIMIDDYRYDGLATEGKITSQIRQAIRNRQAIKDKLWLILDGNHPRKLWKFGRITKDVCEELGVRYGDWSTTLRYEDKKGDLLFRHYCAHGFGSVNSRIDDPRDRKNSMLRTLRRVMQDKVGGAMLMSMGHVHRLLICNPTKRLYIETDGKIQQRYTAPDASQTFIDPSLRWYVATGSFYKTYAEGISSYAEIAGYDPIQLGCAIALVRDKKLVEVREFLFT